MPRSLMDDIGLDIYASPDTKRYYLGRTSNYVEFKSELDYGERKMLDGAAIRGYERQMAEAGRDVDTSSNTLMFITQLDRVAPLRLAVWLSDWHLMVRRPDGTTEPEELPDRLEDRIALFRRMRESFATQLTEILDTHEEETRKAREADDVAAGIIERHTEEPADPNPSPTPAGGSGNEILTLPSVSVPAGPSPS